MTLYYNFVYDVSALHYLMKPVDKERLFQALDRMAEAKREEGINLVLNGAGGGGYGTRFIPRTPRLRIYLLL